MRSIVGRNSYSGEPFPAIGHQHGFPKSDKQRIKRVLSCVTAASSDHLAPRSGGGAEPGSGLQNGRDGRQCRSTRSASRSLRSQSWLNDAYINVAVNDGVVELWGLVVSADQHRASRILVEETEGETAREQACGGRSTARRL
jgi:hypothetical protein